MKAKGKFYVFWAVLLYYFVFLYTYCEARIITAKSLSYSDVSDAITSASYNDTIYVPSGSATWNNTLIITRGITLKGAGIDKTVITRLGSGYIIEFIPDAITGSNDYKFEISRFTFNGGNGIYLHQNSARSTAFRKIKIHNNKFTNTNSYPIYVAGNFWGVVYENEFAGALGFMILGNNRVNWDTFKYGAYGNANNLYFEDNTFSGDAMFWIQSGHGGRWAFRFNNSTATYMGNPLFDQHGNQSGGIYALMVCEIYENTFIGFTKDVNRWEYQRGGRLIAFNNSFFGNGDEPQASVNDDVDDSMCPVNNPDSSIQHPNNVYFWNNTWNNRRYGAIEGEDCCNSIKEDSEFFNEQSSFDGSSGMGVGPLAARPASASLIGAGYWATDVGEWNTKKNGPDGILYRWNGTAWIQYYTPFAYPHPLRGPEPPANLIFIK